MIFASDEVHRKFTELYTQFLSPYKDDVDRLQAELEARLVLHRASEDARLAPYRRHVEGLQRESDECREGLAALRPFYEQTLRVEEARLAPLRARSADVASYCALVQGAVRARADVVAATAALGPLDPRYAPLESAHESERWILIELLRISMSFEPCALNTHLQAEMDRSDAPPLSAMRHEIDCMERELASLRQQLADARGALCGQMEAGSAAWDCVAVRINEALCSAVKELAEAIPGLRRRAEQSAIAFFQEPGGY